MKNMKIRALTDTAVAAAVCSLLTIIVIYVPFLSIPMSLAVGTPLMYISYKWDWRFSVLAAICSIIASSVLVGEILSLGLIILIYACPGLVFGICSSKKVNFFISIMLSAIAVLIGLVIELIIINGGGDGIENMLKGITDNMAQMLSETASLTGALPPETKSIIDEVLAQTRYVFMLYLPSFIIIGAIIYSYCISMFGLFVLKRVGVKNIKFTKFYMIKASKGMCIITAILFLVCSFSDVNGLYMSALQNLYLLSVTAIAICGLSAIDYKFKEVVRSGYIRALIYVAVFLFGSIFATYIMSILTVVGLIDGMGNRRNFEKVGDESSED